MDDLTQRVRRLEDIEEIRRVKAMYCHYCDVGYDADGIASLMTENALWDGGRTFGVHRGREAIRDHFSGAAQRVTIARHQVMNPIIDVGVDGDDDVATGQWLLFQPCTVGDEAVWLAATYHDQYRRVDGRWLIDETVIDVAFFTPADRNWVEQRFLPGREP